MAPEREASSPESPTNGLLVERIIQGERWYEVNRAMSVRAGHLWPVRLNDRLASLVTSLTGDAPASSTATRPLHDLLWVASVTLSDAGQEERYVPFEAVWGRTRLSLLGCVDTTDGLAVHIIALDAAAATGG